MLSDQRGRFDRIIKLCPLAERCRRQMLLRLPANPAASETDMEHLVAVTKNCTDAQLEQLVNTLYIRTIAEDNAGARGVHGDSVLFDRNLVGAAVEEVRIERNMRPDFHGT